MLDSGKLIVAESEENRIKFELRPEFDALKTGKVFELLRSMGDSASREERDSMGRAICELFDDPSVDRQARLVHDATPMVFLTAHLATAEVFEHLTATHADATPSVRVRSANSESGILEFMARRQPTKDDDKTLASGCNSSSDRLEIYRLLIQRADINPGYDPKEPSHNFSNLFTGSAKKERRFEKAIRGWIRNRHALITANDKQQLISTLDATVREVHFSSDPVQEKVIEAAHALVSDAKLVKKLTGKLPLIKGRRLRILEAEALDIRLISDEEKGIAHVNTAVAIWKRAVREATRKSMPKRERMDLQNQGRAIILKK